LFSLEASGGALRSFVCVVGAVCLINCFAGPVAAAPAALQPTKPWDIDYGEAQCTAMREYGSADAPVTLAIIPALDGSSYELIATYKRNAPQVDQEFEGKIYFGARWISSWALKYGAGKWTMYQFRVSAADIEQARSAPTIGLRLNGELDVSFTLDHVADLMAALQKCTADLQDFWNVGRDRSGRIVLPAKGDVRAEFSVNDYPADALRHLQGGTGQYVLLIDEKGALAGCHVLVPTGVPELDAVACLVIKERSKFIPAKDASGKPVRSALTTPKIIWKIAE
jgi:Gram-negative bacterial TonB protein C-terminal